MKPTLITSILAGALALALPLAAEADPQIAIPFPETTSPDGTWVIGWGDQNWVPVDPTNKKAVRKLVETGSPANFLVKTDSGEVMAETGTEFFRAEDLVKNHGSLQAYWRSDSQAVLVVEGAKWEFAKVELLRELEVGGESAFERIDLTESLRLKFRQHFLKTFPEKQADIERWTFSMRDVKWLDDQTVELIVLGAVPKSEDAFGYEGFVKVILPSDAWLQVREVE